MAAKQCNGLNDRSASLTRPPHGLTAHHGARRRIVLSCAHRVLSARAVEATLCNAREDPTPQGLRVTKPPPPSDAALAWSPGLRERLVKPATSVVRCAGILCLAGRQRGKGGLHSRRGGPSLHQGA